MNDAQIKNQLPVGTVLQGKNYRYRIEKALGQGTFGITYLASVKMQGALGELDCSIHVAVKEFFMHETNGRAGNTVTSGSKGGLYDKYRNKFAREAENLSRLRHPHIVKVLESFEANNTVYYAMEYIDGGSLDERICMCGGLSQEESVGYLKQIGSALSYMHRNKMLHLDLKPANVVLRKSGEAVLIDFGLSKQYDDNGKPETTTSVGLGTPGYASIEQAHYRDGKDFPVVMDVYALGATFFKMLVGVRPPDASEILNDGFPAYELQKHNVSDSLLSVIVKAMAPMKKNRYQTVEELLEALTHSGRGEDTTLLEEETIFEGLENTILVDEESKADGKWDIDGCAPFPIGFQLRSDSSVYEIVECLSKDVCSYVYKAIRKGKENEDVILLENMPNEFMGGRVGGSSGGYEIDFSISDFNEWTGLFVEKIKRLSESCRILESFSVGYATNLVSFSAPIKKELLDDCIMKKKSRETDVVPIIKMNKDKVRMDDVASVSFLYCEPSFPGFGSFKAEIAATSIQVEFAVMGNVVKQYAFPFSKNKFRELKLRLDSLGLHVKDITGPGLYDGCASIHLTLHGATHTFSAGCLCSGDGEWRSGELHGDIPMLLKVIRQTIPDFYRLWQAAKSTAEPKPTPRPQPSPKPQPKNKKESPEVKNLWWPLLVLPAWGIMILLFTWGGNGRIPLPDWIAVIMFVGNMTGLFLLTKGKKLWGFVAVYASLLLAILWALGH